MKFNISGVLNFPDNHTKSITLSIKSKTDFKFNNIIEISSNGVYNFFIDEGTYILSLNDVVITSNLVIDKNDSLNSLIMSSLER